jgi:hypothetical protein
MENPHSIAERDAPLKKKLCRTECQDGPAFLEVVLAVVCDRRVVGSAVHCVRTLRVRRASGARTRTRSSPQGSPNHRSPSCACWPCQLHNRFDLLGHDRLAWVGSKPRCRESRRVGTSTSLASGVMASPKPTSICRFTFAAVTRAISVMRIPPYCCSFRMNAACNVDTSKRRHRPARGLQARRRRHHARAQCPLLHFRYLDAFLTAHRSDSLRSGTAPSD